MESLSEQSNGILSTIFSKKFLKIGALAVGGLTVALGGVLYLQYKQELTENENLIKDIYSIEQITAFLEDELYESYPIIVEVAQWVPLANREISLRLQGKNISPEQHA